MPYWEPEPDDSVSDEEYDAWERRNPRWCFCEDIGLKLDQDFVELCFDIEDVISQVERGDARRQIATRIPTGHNCFFMLGETALRNKVEPVFTLDACAEDVSFIGKYIYLT